MDRRRLLIGGAGAALAVQPGRARAASDIEVQSLPPVRGSRIAQAAYDPAGEAAPPAYGSAPAYTPPPPPPSYAPPASYPPPPAGASGPYSAAAGAPGYGRQDAQAAAPPDPQVRIQPSYPSRAETYSQAEIVRNVSDFFGVTAEAAGGLIERVFHDNGRPTGYIAGEEGSGAFIGGLR